jgi:hypothetical protein
MAYSSGVTERALETVIQKVGEHPVPSPLSNPSGNSLIKGKQNEQET